MKRRDGLDTGCRGLGLFRRPLCLLLPKFLPNGVLRTIRSVYGDQSGREVLTLWLSSRNGYDQALAPDRPQASAVRGSSEPVGGLHSWSFKHAVPPNDEQSHGPIDRLTTTGESKSLACRRPPWL